MSGLQERDDIGGIGLGPPAELEQLVILDNEVPGCGAQLPAEDAARHKDRVAAGRLCACAAMTVPQLCSCVKLE